MQVKSTLLIAALASLTYAQAENPATTSWTIKNLSFTCDTAKRTCDHKFLLDAPPGTFSISCEAKGVPWADKTFRDCTATQGANRITSAQAYVELRPGRPLVQTEMAISVGITAEAGNAQSTEYYQAKTMKSFDQWQTQRGKEFSLKPEMVAIA